MKKSTIMSKKLKDKNNKGTVILPMKTKDTIPNFFTHAKNKKATLIVHMVLQKCYQEVDQPRPAGTVSRKRSGLSGSKLTLFTQNWLDLAGSGRVMISWQTDGSVGLGTRQLLEYEPTT